ncbi:hypothetical protein SH2C18_07690 [Clostridium sediminicola]|uniref:O-antigen ligase family protein n=1 Tax=Clostridium sediminicola TaxID=3114879 RepID=UPI0031F256C0
MLILMFFIVFSPYLSVVSLVVTSYITIKKNKIVFNNLWNKGMLLMFIWSIITSIINKSILSLGVSFVFLLLFLFGIFLEKNFYSEEKINKLLKNILFLSIGSAIVGFIERITEIQHIPSWWGKLFGINQFAAKGISPRITGTFGNQNIAGTWYGVMILISLYFYFNEKNKNKFLYAITACLFTIVLVLTGSRGGILGLAIGIVIYLYLSKNKKKAIIIALLSCIGLILIFKFPNYFPRGDVLYITLNKRGFIWKKTFEMIKLKPMMGWGFLGTYFYKGLNEPHGHNIILTFASSLGIIGLMIFTIMNYYLIKELRFLNKNNCKYVPVLASVIALIFGQGIFDCTIMNPQVGVIYFGASALINAIAYENKYVFVHKRSIQTLLSPMKKQKSVELK